MDINNDIVKLIVAFLAIIGAGAFITYKVRKKKNSDNSTIINQTDNTVTNGDIVGGNKTVNKK